MRIQAKAVGAPKRSDATRERILQAATAEFAAYGIAGARVDRIARNAAGNKNLIYMYFGSKQQLFTAVLRRHLTHVYDSVAFTPEDVPGYAARLCDFVMDHPALTRLLLWFGLEQEQEQAGDKEPTQLTQFWDIEPEGAVQAKLAGITKAQREGRITREFSPAFLITVVVALCSAWTAANPLHAFVAPGAAKHRAKLRRSVAQAVERLVRADA